LDLATLELLTEQRPLVLGDGALNLGREQTLRVSEIGR
jgi:hypothetical protein